MAVWDELEEPLNSQSVPQIHGSGNKQSENISKTSIVSQWYLLTFSRVATVYKNQIPRVSRKFSRSSRQIQQEGDKKKIFPGAFKCTGIISQLVL